MNVFLSILHYLWENTKLVFLVVSLKASDLNCYIYFFGTTIKDYTEIEIFIRSKSCFPTPSATREK